MSNRSLIELNHDFSPMGDDASLLAWARQMRFYFGSARPEELPQGVTLKHFRHHTEPCPLELKEPSLSEQAAKLNKALDERDGENASVAPASEEREAYLNMIERALKCALPSIIRARDANPPLDPRVATPDDYARCNVGVALELLPYLRAALTTPATVPQGDVEALQRFKDYVHKRLDEAGIPTHPEGEHSKHGCRIGDRLDIALAAIVPPQQGDVDEARIASIIAATIKKWPSSLSEERLALGFNIAQTIRPYLRTSATVPDAAPSPDCREALRGALPKTAEAWAFALAEASNAAARAKAVADKDTFLPAVEAIRRQAVAEHEARTPTPPITPEQREAWQPINVMPKPGLYLVRGDDTPPYFRDKYHDHRDIVRVGEVVKGKVGAQKGELFWHCAVTGKQIWPTEMIPISTIERMGGKADA